MPLARAKDVSRAGWHGQAGQVDLRNIESGPRPAPPCGAAVGYTVSTTNRARAVVEGLEDPVANSTDSNQEAVDSDALVSCADASTPSIDPPGRRMSPVTAAVVAVFCPSRAAAGTRGVSLWRLLWAHVFGAVLGAIAVLFVVSTGDTEALALEDVFSVVGDVAVGIVRGFIRYPGESFLTLLAIVAGIELVFAVVAFHSRDRGPLD